MIATLRPINLLASFQPEPWRAEARCKGVPLSVFFPPPNGPSTYDAARTYCTSCPVKAECLADACATDAEGFRGGMSPIERGKHRRRTEQARTCRLCDARFTSPANRPPAMYCSDDCRNEARRRVKNRYRAKEAS